MLTRRTFIQGAGALAAGAATGGIALQKPEIKEHGLVEIRFCLFDKDPIVVKTMIFSDEQRDVFGIRVLGERGACDMSLAELRLSSVKAALADPGRIQRCLMHTWSAEGKEDKGLLDLVAKDGNLLVAGSGELEKGPVWMSLADVQRVL